jgi:AcrR family transcriptional regulator
MPKPARSQADIKLARERILDEALSIISEFGFAHFSMRKLASRLGMTATTIYNYYSSKDELYLMILTKGFQELVTSFRKINSAIKDPHEKFRTMVRSYIDFGINKAHYYNIMFTSDAPKYLDYVGTPIEQVAYFEKETAIQLIAITSEVAYELVDHAQVPQDIIRLLILRLWTSLHGIITLYNSRVIHEIADDPDEVLRMMVDDIMESFQESFLKLSEQNNRVSQDTLEDPHE